jgi:hypothetical protein
MGIAERAMYFGAPLFNAGHESTEVTMPAKTWFHAEGATSYSAFKMIAGSTLIARRSGSIAATSAVTPMAPRAIHSVAGSSAFTS